MHPVFPAETFIPAKILFKKGAVADLAKETAEFGAIGLIVHGASFEKNGLKEKISLDFKKKGARGRFFLQVLRRTNA